MVHLVLQCMQHITALSSHKHWVQLAVHAHLKLTGTSVTLGLLLVCKPLEAYCCEGCPTARASHKTVRACSERGLLYSAWLAYCFSPENISSCVCRRGACWLLFPPPEAACLSATTAASIQVDHLATTEAPLHEPITPLHTL